MDQEAELQIITAEDHRSQHDEKRLFSEQWFTLSNAGSEKEQQYQKFLQIRRTLKEYSTYLPPCIACILTMHTYKCLIQQAQIAKLEKPFPYDLKMLRRWLSHPEHGNVFLVGSEARTWDEAYTKDFVVIPRPDGELERDALSRLFLGPFVQYFHNLLGRFFVVGVFLSYKRSYY